MKFRSDRGFTLMAALVMVVLVGGIATALLLASTNEAKAGDQSRTKMKATYISEAGAEDAAFQIRFALANISPVPTATTLTIGGSPVACAIVPIGTLRSSTDPTGLQSTHRQYEIVAQNTFDKTMGRVIRTVDAQSTPIFQFLAFYNDDLEILPGPAANLQGRIHTNRDLYIGSGATLKINSEYVHAAGEMYRHRKDDGSAPAGSVSVKVAGSSTFQNWGSALESNDATWAQDAQTNWNGSVKNGEMGVSVMETPAVGATDPGGYYHQNANVVVQDNQLIFMGTNVTSLLPAGTLATNSTYDAREGTFVATTTVDMAKLKGTPYWPPNGLLYGLKTNNTAASPKGIVLKNGSELPAGLTVVSNGPVYVQGDYNAKPSDPAYVKKPAAIIADAVNLLSNSWNNSKGPSSGLPNASATTYNFAMITGNQNTSGGNYNGGFENLPRFHENWTGVACKIRGAFVNLWRSRIADGAWVYGGNKYTAPNRDWDYDTDFNDPAKLPPFTPLAVSIIRTVYEEGYRR
jgi:hypothetical protein